MADSRIMKYINDMLSQGYKEDEIGAALLKQGWHGDEINEAFAAIKSDPEAPLGTPQGTMAQAPPGTLMDTGGKPPAKVSHVHPSAGAHKDKIPLGGLILTGAGGIIILANAILVFLEAGDILGFIVPGVSISLLSILSITLSSLDTLLINLIIGGFLMGISYIIYRLPGRAKIMGILAVLLSLTAVVVGDGFLIGGIIGTIGGIFTFLKK